jgi:hypothetical protein
MKKLKVFSIVLTVVSAIFLGYSLYLHRSYAKVNDKAIAICNMFTKLDPTYTKYFSSPPPSSPWYIQVAPDLILLAGITSVILAFYLSPKLRNGFKTLINKYLK